jgi:hypothetical protein
MMETYTCEERLCLETIDVEPDYDLVDGRYIDRSRILTPGASREGVDIYYCAGHTVKVAA